MEVMKTIIKVTFKLNLVLLGVSSCSSYLGTNGRPVRGVWNMGTNRKWHK